MMKAVVLTFFALALGESVGGTSSPLLIREQMGMKFSHKPGNLCLRGGFSIISNSPTSSIAQPHSAEVNQFPNHLIPSFLTMPFQMLKQTSTQQSAPAPAHHKDAVERSIIVDATPDEVFQVATNFEKYPEWAGVSSVQIKERGQDGLAKIVKLDSSLFGRSISYTLSYKYARPHRMHWHAVAGSLKELVGRYDFHRVGPKRTKVVYKIVVETGFYLPRVVKASSSAFIASAALNNLKQFTELERTQLWLHGGRELTTPQNRHRSPIWSLSTLM
mmetsp:Transcript_88782/g.236311  ORF Transcript_88782/g.236311 Transcript_88782/m.236311 type:complete len:274 (+) Transcript_88782:173-994(+)